MEENDVLMHEAGEPEREMPEEPSEQELPETDADLPEEPGEHE